MIYEVELSAVKWSCEANSDRTTDIDVDGASFVDHKYRSFGRISSLGNYSTPTLGVTLNHHHLFPCSRPLVAWPPNLHQDLAPVSYGLCPSAR